MENGSLYHIYNRGNNKQPIFFEKRNYQHFLNRFDKYLSSFLDGYAYCLMPNHFHFLAKVVAGDLDCRDVLDYGSLANYRSLKHPGSLNPQTAPLSPLEKAFKTFFMSYAKGINQAYHRTGALFQQKCKKKEITNDGYFTSIIQYIHANPIAAGICKSYEDWEFSSYNAIIGKQPTKIKREEVLEWFGGREKFIKIHQERKLDKEEMRRFLY